MSGLKSSDVWVSKIIVIGDSGVGKTSLVLRFVCGEFKEKYQVTIGVDFAEKSVQIDGELMKLQLWDTAGQDRFRKSIIQQYYRNANAVVFVYDVTNLASFESLPAWVKECERNLAQAVPWILVGNKLDCGEQVVRTDVAQKFAEKHDMLLFETSALDDDQAKNVESIFMALARKLKASKGLMPSEKRASIVLLRADAAGRRDSLNLGADATKKSNSCVC